MNRRLFSRVIQQVPQVSLTLLYPLIGKVMMKYDCTVLFDHRVDDLPHTNLGRLGGYEIASLAKTST